MDVVLVRNALFLGLALYAAHQVLTAPRRLSPAGEPAMLG